MSFIYALSDNRWSNGATTYNGIWMDFTNGAGGSAVGAAASRIFKLTNNLGHLISIDLNGTIFAGDNGGNPQYGLSYLDFGNPCAALIFRVFTTQAAAVNGQTSGIPGFGAHHNGVYAFASTSSGYAPNLDTYIMRRMAAIVSAHSALATQVYTLASLSASVATAVSAGAGARAFISNSNSSTYGLTASATASGGIQICVFSDGTQWKIG